MNPSLSWQKLYPKSLARLLHNPVLRRETRSRLRGARTVVILTTFMAILSITFYITYITTVSHFRWSPWSLSEAGRDIFLVLACFECGLIMILAPAFACSTVTSERESNTLDLLKTTRLTPGSILAGKLAASLYYVVMLLFSSLPIFATCLMLGGLSPLQIFLSVVILLATTFFYGGLGLFFSVMVKRSATASALSYIAVLLLNLGPLGLAAFIALLIDSRLDEKFFMAASTSSPISNLIELLWSEFHREMMQEIGVAGPILTWPGYLILSICLGFWMIRKMRRELLAGQAV